MKLFTKKTNRAVYPKSLAGRIFFYKGQKYRVLAGNSGGPCLSVPLGVSDPPAELCNHLRLIGPFSTGKPDSGYGSGRPLSGYYSRMEVYLTGVPIYKSALKGLRVAGHKPPIDIRDSQGLTSAFNSDYYKMPHNFYPLFAEAFQRQKLGKEFDLANPACYRK